MTSPDSKLPQDVRDEDCEHDLHLAYFDSSEDDEARFRHQKPVTAKDAAAARLRAVAL